MKSCHERRGDPINFVVASLLFSEILEFHDFSLYAEVLCSVAISVTRSGGEICNSSVIEGVTGVTKVLDYRLGLTRRP